MQSFASPMIIIGAGSVGLRAALQIGQAWYRPVMVEAAPFTGGQCAALYPKGAIHDAPEPAPVTARELTSDLKARLTRYDPLILTSRRAKSVWGSLESGFNVETDTGETITGAAVIYAGGAGALRPRSLTVEGAASAAKDISFASDSFAAAGRKVAVVDEGQAAIDLALKAATEATSESLIHSIPLRTEQRRITDLARSATQNRLSVINGALARVQATDDRLSKIEVSVNGRRQAHDIDLLLVKAGLEYVAEPVTGLGAIANPATGETETPGIFVIGDAVPSPSRPPIIAAGYAEATRAATAVINRLGATAPETADIDPHLNVA